MPNPKQENVVALPARRPPSALVPTPLSPGATPMLVPFPRWQKACDRVSAALLSGETRVVITGPPGTGKTLLLDQITRVLRAAGWTVMLRLADAGPPPTQNGSVALLIDEADRLSRESLQQLLVGTSAPVVLAGLEVLQSRVAGATQIALSPLGREESRDYIAHWLALSGRSPANLEATAMRRTIEISGGVPRLASTLLGAAAWLAESADERVITVQHIDEAAALRSCFVSGEHDVDMAAQSAPERRRAPVLLAVVACMLLLGVGAYVSTRYYTAQTDQAVSTVRDAAARLQAAISERLTGPAETKAPPPIASAAPTTTPPEPVPAKTPRHIDIAAAPATSEAPPPAAPVPIALAQPPAPAPAATEPPPAQPTVQPAATIVAPTPPVPMPAPSAAIISSAPALEQPRTLTPETISLLLRRGADMMTIGDVSAARLLFGRAAEAGNVDAMLAMGRTFDPVVLAQASPMLTGDRAEAISWYRRAADLGSPAAAEALRNFQQRRNATE